jgi:arylsulfatase A-like enzyme
MTLPRAARLAAVSALLALAIGCSRPAAPPAPADTRPNLLLITIESTSAKNLHAYGYAREVSPTLDRLAAEGSLWENAYAGGDCTPVSLAAIATGVPAPLPCVRGFEDKVPAGMPTLAETLKRAGYATMFAGWAADSLRHSGLDRGYDRLIDSGRWRFYDVPADKLVVETVRFVREQAGRPWFVQLHFLETHCPYLPGPYYREQFSSDSEFKNDQRTLAPGDLTNYCLDERLFEVRPASLRVRDYVAAHDGALLYVDTKIGDLLGELRHLGAYDRTAIAVSADHGELMGEHGIFFAHGVGLYDELLRVPLIVKPAGGSGGGRRIAAPGGHVDLAPTLLAAAGVPAPATMVGRDLLAPDDAREGGPPRIYPALSCTGELGVRRGPLALIGRAAPGDPDGPRVTAFFENGKERPAPEASEARALERALAELEGALAACKTHPAEPLSPETVRRLKALGYLP